MHVARPTLVFVGVWYHSQLMHSCTGHVIFWHLQTTDASSLVLSRQIQRPQWMSLTVRALTAVSLVLPDARDMVMFECMYISHNESEVALGELRCGEVCSMQSREFLVGYVVLKLLLVLCRLACWTVLRIRPLCVPEACNICLLSPFFQFCCQLAMSKTLPSFQYLRP